MKFIYIPANLPSRWFFVLALASLILNIEYTFIQEMDWLGEYKMAGAINLGILSLGCFGWSFVVNNDRRFSSQPDGQVVNALVNPLANSASRKIVGVASKRKVIVYNHFFDFSLLGANIAFVVAAVYGLMCLFTGAQPTLYLLCMPLVGITVHVAVIFYGKSRGLAVNGNEPSKPIDSIVN